MGVRGWADKSFSLVISSFRGETDDIELGEPYSLRSIYPGGRPSSPPGIA